MADSKPINTPLSEKEKLSAVIKVQAQADQDYMSKVPYSSAVGSLMYAMVCTRPDLAYAVSMVSRFLNQPQKEHWKAVKRIFRYLKGIAYVGLIYGSHSDCCLTGYSDADFAVDLVKRRSLIGYDYTLGGCLVSWKATLQPSVALSTTEAEYMALTKAAKEGIWLRGLINDLGINQEYANIYCDNLSAICLAKDQVHHDRTKHIDVRYHFIRSERRIKVHKISTLHNLADMFTKPVPKSKFDHCLSLLNVDCWG
ncbi:secreted RxLR effector protein 161-like [Glycine max]|uniref:secreted RxLR effector protein 161-like n=1 Tax=Glycine max TaxID=3847 RepID=UPI001B3573ED|nr:secreted RxLR effector protein 161-like [Glycine max]